MAADGSIIINTEIDDKKAQQELNRLNRKIESINDQIYTKKQQQLPLVEEAKRLGAVLDEAKAKLAYMQSGEKFFTSAHVKEQENAVRELQKEWDSVQRRVEQYDASIQKSSIELDLNKERAGEVQLQLAKSGVDGGKMAAALERARKSAGRFSLRLREVVRSALVFTVISQGLASFRDWLVKVIKSNAEATAAIARLKGALLTLVQPLVEVIIPAFTIFVNVVSDLIATIARVVSLLFGTTASQSAEAAKNLNEEQEAIEGVGGAAEEATKSFADFDEIKKLSGDTSSGGAGESGGGAIEPDFSALEENWLADRLGEVAGMVTAALLLGGIALVAIGAATGSLLTVTAGLLLLQAGVTVGTETGVLQSWVDTLGLNSVEEFVVSALIIGGIALVVIGAAMGNILMVLAGLALIGYAVAVAISEGVIDDWAEKLGLSKAAQFVTAALLIGGIALVVIGAIMKNALMVLAGLGLLAAGIYVGVKSGTLESWAKALGLDSVFEYVAAALQLGGIAMIAIGAAMGNMFMVIAGLVLLSAGVAAQAIGEETLKNWWEVLKLTNVQQWVSVALLLVGIALIAIGAVMGNILMILAGAALVGLGTVVAVSNNNLKDWVTVLGLQKVVGWVTAALLLAGIGLIVFGIVSGNILMVIAGLGLLGAGVAVGVTSGTFQNWIDTIIRGLKSGLSSIKSWWAENAAKYFTLEYWQEIGSNMLAGLFNGLSAIGSEITKWGNNFINGVKDFFGIHSPSTEFEELGMYMMYGLEGGVSDNGGHVESAFRVMFSNVKTISADTISEMKTALTDFLHYMRTDFTADWKTLWKDCYKEAETNIKKIISEIDALNAKLASIERDITINITTIKETIESDGLRSSGVPRGVRSVDPAALRAVSLPASPMAAGAVIPPNSRFLSAREDAPVSGGGTELSLSTMVQALKIALRESGMGGENTLVMEVDREQFGKLVYRANKRESRRMGVSLVEV